MIIVRTFRAPDDPEACLRFYNGHLRLLEIHFGIAKITSGNADWMQHKNSIVVIVEDETGTKTYGGARVQVADGILPLPIETAIGKYDPKIHDLSKIGTGEVCAMWNSKEVAGMGIGSVILGRVCAAILPRLPLHMIHVLCAPITTRMGKRIGCVINTSLGNNGHFFYPKEGFIATAMELTDIDTLNHADPKERELIFDLRRNPVQKRSEVGPKGEFEVDYNLLFN